MTKSQPGVTLTFHVKSYDIDFAGVVSNIVYLRWLEDLRLELLATVVPLRQLVEAGIVPVVVETQIQYRRPITLFDRPVGRMWSVPIAGNRWRTEAEFRLGTLVSAHAVQDGCFVDLQTKRPVALPDAFRCWQES